MSHVWRDPFNLNLSEASSYAVSCVRERMCEGTQASIISHMRIRAIDEMTKTTRKLASHLDKQGPNAFSVNRCGTVVTWVYHPPPAAITSNSTNNRRKRITSMRVYTCIYCTCAGAVHSPMASDK